MRATPLRVKLLAAVLALVFAALTLISVASTLALRSYLLSRMDDELKATTANLATNLRGIAVRQLDPTVYIPSEYMFAICDTHGVGDPYKSDRRLRADDLPTCINGLSEIEERQADQPFTVVSRSKQYHWRMVIADLPNGDYLYVGRNMTEIEYAMSRLVWIDFLLGTGVLLALAVVGAAIVRTSLRPLTDIEQTAGAIAAGDLTRRVPDPEPDSEEPQTELGRLSRALNAMLAQIETAFTARAQSETAARAAESVARDAADAAQLSEARAVRSEEKMRQFVADASHELRTPLTTIRGFAELYRQGAVADPADVARLVRRIEDEAARMGLLVEDLLLLARLDRERPLTLAPVELPVLAVDAVHAAQATAPERSIELDVRDDADKLVAYGDDARLRQVIGNLMTNALTHTPPDAAVTLRVFREDGNRVAVEVSDTGPGLSAEQRDRVFERFYRADQARTRNTDREATGTGLGLAIVAAIVRAHHGSVEVVSEDGKGATFRVTLPALDADVPAER
ncbi:sensor histidine kinase [Krasilnikovia sp. MM14-A1259]|uniref:sensor histidine kinase n=1 Tax=Krasilnikovia sp. MM14-A1259 TaxID=3373539 RepID=UPI0038080D6A